LPRKKKKIKRGYALNIWKYCRLTQSENSTKLGKKGKLKILITSTSGSDQEGVSRALSTHEKGERNTFLHSIKHISRGDALIIQEKEKTRQKLCKRKCINAKLQR